MKKLANTLYITNPDRYLSLEGENIVVICENKTIGRVPLHNLEAVITFGYTGVSPALMGACAARNIALTFLSGTGRFLAHITGEINGNVLLRKKQYRISENKDESLRISKNFIIGKLYNTISILRRTLKDHALSVDKAALEKTITDLKEAISSAEEADKAETLRGVEGEAALKYFSVLDQLILQQKDVFYFKSRIRRPPTDPFNALLSLFYSLLAYNCASALSAAGLDPYVGFFHTDRPGRISLALDLMEELRPIMADKFVLSLVNRKMVNKKSFVKKENGAVLLNDDVRKEVLSAWQQRKKETITHPFLNEKIEWGIVPIVQAQLLARYLRGDLDSYPPFLWK